MLRARRSANLVRVLVTAAGDVAIAIGCLRLASLLRRTVELPFTRDLLPAENFALDLATVALFVLPLLLALELTGFYTLSSSPRHRPTVLFAVPLQVALIATVATFLGLLVPRSVLLLVAVFELALLPLWRRLVRRLVPLRRRRAALIGTAGELAELAADEETLDRAHLRVAALVPLDRPLDHSAFAGLWPDAPARRAIAAADEVIDVSALADGRRRLDLLRTRGPRGYWYVPSAEEVLLAPRVTASLGDRPLAEVTMRGAYGTGAAAKRAFDVAGALLLLLAASPVLVAATLAILVSDGRPVFLRQRRMGKDGKELGMWKLRTMHRRAHLAPARLAVDDDERFTRVGKLLRRYRVDELPQLLNVLAGDMSLVGPRPEIPEIAAAITARRPAFGLRLHARPGLAGLAQVSAEYDQDDEVKLAYDLQYLCSWSVGRDARILLQALAAVLSGRGV
ncbi:MAG TPA: sugar transferase [Thermoanaerobaculia bacterium]|nr:sugar transferase [Thermoanaerobaculia bacterium]